MRDTPFGARRRSRGASRMPHMPDTPRPARSSSNGASRMSGPPGRPRGAAGPPRRTWGGWVFLTAGIWRGVRRAPRGSNLRANLHNTAIERTCASRAVSRMPYMRSTARPRQIGSVVELCMPARCDPSPGRPHLPPGGRRYPQGAAATLRGKPAPHLSRPPLRRRESRPGPRTASTPARHGSRAEPALRQRPARHPCLA